MRVLGFILVLCGTLPVLGAAVYWITVVYGGLTDDPLSPELGDAVGHLVTYATRLILICLPIAMVGMVLIYWGRYRGRA